jgi:uncharacterized protein YjbI with pentapeptide repeats
MKDRAARTPKAQHTPRTLADWLHIQTPPNYPAAPWIGAAIGFVIQLFVIVTAVGILCVPFYFLALIAGWTHLGGADLASALRGVAPLFAAVAAAPFVIWRTMVAQHQADLARAALFNDKVNAATEELAARKQITRVVGTDEGETVLTEWADDLIRRNAAIDRLQGLAQENPPEARRIARLLNIYVIELSKDHPPEQYPVDLDNVDWADKAARADRIQEIKNWTKTLTVKRSDMERAMHSLSALNTQIRQAEGPDAAPVIDMRGQRVNLQKMDLQNCDFENSIFSNTHFDGAYLENVHFSYPTQSHGGRRGGFEGIKFHGATLKTVHFENVHLYKAQFVGCIIDDTYFKKAQETYFIDLRMRGIKFNNAHFSKSKFVNNHLIGYLSKSVIFDFGMIKEGDFTDTLMAHVEIVSELYQPNPRPSFCRNAFWDALFSEGSVSQSEIEQSFGDASVILPSGLSRPAHWPDVVLKLNLGIVPNISSSPFFIEWEAWKANPNTYDWAARKGMYQAIYDDSNVWDFKP